MNRSSGQTPEQLLDRAVVALVREWGVSQAEATAAIERVKEAERRLRRNGPVIRIPEPREPDEGQVVAEGWTLYLDHGALVLGRAE